MAQPFVSVVVPTHNRAARLERLLQSLQLQTVAPGTFEVVVVDDGSFDDTPAVLARWVQHRALQLRAIRHDLQRGPAASRNTGWRSARGTLIAFTDDDCRADPIWIQAALSTYASREGAIVQGRTLPDPHDAADRGLRTRTVSVESLGPQYETCNVFYPRDVLERLGGFDERFGRRPAAEDTDLAWRAIERGTPIVFAPSALVLHAVERVSTGQTLRIATRWTEATRVFRDHPQARSMLFRGVFWNVWHYLLWRSLLALAAPAWLRRIVLARHLLSLRRRAAQAGAGAWAIPFLLVHDAVECGAVARGAVRHRTLVL